MKTIASRRSSCGSERPGLCKSSEFRSEFNFGGQRIPIPCPIGDVRLALSLKLTNDFIQARYCASDERYGFICLRRSLEGCAPRPLRAFEVQDPSSLDEAIVAGIGRERIRVSMRDQQRVLRIDNPHRDEGIGAGCRGERVCDWNPDGLIPTNLRNMRAK